jgi:hypothetical protein
MDLEIEMRHDGDHIDSDLDADSIEHDYPDEPEDAASSPDSNLDDEFDFHFPRRGSKRRHHDIHNFKYDYQPTDDDDAILYPADYEFKQTHFTDDNYFDENENENENENEHKDNDIENANNNEYDHSHPIIGRISRPFQNCGICQESCTLSRWDLSHIDHSAEEILDSPILCFLHVCQLHYICTRCVRESLRLNTETTLRQGHGHFPCFECTTTTTTSTTNTITTPRTIILNTLREFFEDTEWRPIRLIQQRVLDQISQDQSSLSTIPWHKYLVPLTPAHQVTGSQIRDRIIQILQQDIVVGNSLPVVNCAICQMDLHKTSACSALRHCDWEICWICGRVERRLSADHWSQCIQFDSDHRWKTIGYRCTENYCFDEVKPCSRHTHHSGIYAYHQMRQYIQILRLVESMEPWQLSDMYRLNQIDHIQFEQWQNIVNQARDFLTRH